MITSRMLNVTPIAHLCGILITFGMSLMASADHRSAFLDNAAYQLELDAHHFHDVVHQRTGLSHLDSASLQLTAAASHLHQSIEHGTSFSHLRRDFAQVRSLFLHINYDLNHAYDLHHDPHVLHDWQRVSASVYRLGHYLRMPVTGGAYFRPSVSSHYTPPVTTYPSGNIGGSISIGPLRFRF